MAETIGLFFLLPVIALALAIFAVLLRFVPDAIIDRFPESPLLIEVVATLVLIGIGRAYFGWRFASYVRDPTATIHFDSEEDERIIFWQKVVLVILYAVVIPCGSLVVVSLVD